MKVVCVLFFRAPLRKQLKVLEMLQNFGHAVVSPVPSLFNIKDSRIKELPGVAAQVTVTVKDTKLTSTGPLLITHWE
jgi:predicted flavoprotein YhiN